MPRNVRNFWVEGVALEADSSVNLQRGREVAFGPRSKGGEIDITIKQRDAGGIIEAVFIRGRAHDDGSLKLFVEDAKGRVVLRVDSKR